MRTARSFGQQTDLTSLAAPLCHKALSISAVDTLHCIGQHCWLTVLYSVQALVQMAPPWVSGAAQLCINWQQ